MSNEVSKCLSEIIKKPYYTQMLIGASSGWVTGYSTMKFGKLAAFAIGSGIILLEVAHHEGLIKLDWSKLSKKIDKIEDNLAGRDPDWATQAERFVDRKLDRAEDLLKKKSQKAKKWYSRLIGDDTGPKFNDLHVFLTAFVGGAALGIAMA